MYERIKGVIDTQRQTDETDESCVRLSHSVGHSGIQLGTPIRIQLLDCRHWALSRSLGSISVSFTVTVSFSVH